MLDYASEDTRKKGEALIQKELENVPNLKVREKAREYIDELVHGQRDFRF